MAHGKDGVTSVPTSQSAGSWGKTRVERECPPVQTVFRPSRLPCGHKGGGPTPEQPSPGDPQPETQELTHEQQARDEFALLTLLHVRLGCNSDMQLVYPLPTPPGLSA